MPIAYECRGCGARRPAPWEGVCCDDPRAGPFRPASICRTVRCRGCHRHYDLRRVQSSMPGAKKEQPIDGQVMSIQDAVEGAVEHPRVLSGINGLDHVLGGGAVPGSSILICGSPGSGKSTLVLQAFQGLARKRHDVLYATGEETMNQVGLRSRKLGKFPARFQAVYDRDLDAILDHLDDVEPDAFAIDSVQKVRVGEDYSPGSPESIKIAIEELAKWAQEASAVMFVIGHITKDGAIRGAKTLEHEVDVVLYLACVAGKKRPRRMLHCDSKNRYGETPREAPFEMTGQGLRDLHVVGKEGEDEVVG